MDDLDKLLYEKSNTYRIHADNLRWILLGGYAAFFGATIQYTNNASIGVLLFFVSICYFFVLAVQNWYYNLFSRYVKDCEMRLKEKSPLLSMKEFNDVNSASVNPFHESYFFAYVCVLMASSVYLVKGFELGLWLAMLLILVLLVALFFSMKCWNFIVYETIIKRLSSLFSK